MLQIVCEVRSHSWYLGEDTSIYFDWIQRLVLELLDAVDLSIQPLQAHRTESTGEAGACEERHSLGRSEDGEDGVWVADRMSNFLDSF